MSKYFAHLFVVFAFCGMTLQAQTTADDYEEIPVFLRVQGIGGYEIFSVYSYTHSRIYLPVTDLFTLLRINQQTSPQYDTISGFLLDESKSYLIDYPNRRILMQRDTIHLKDNDIIQTNTGLYLYLGLFGKAFGLYGTFNFRTLSIEIKTDLELPAIRDLRIAQMQKNLDMLKGDVEVDTIIGRQYHWFRFGMADWAINATQTIGEASDYRLSAGIGAEFLGGETNVLLNYTSNNGFDRRNQSFSWRLVNNNSPVVRQIMAGKLTPRSISTIYDPLYGIVVTNAPTTYRRSFGEYTMAGYTEPGWTTELYINGVLIDYQKADASGFYTFDVPLVYGAAEVLIKFYGPYGEQRIRKETTNIPYSFLPQGEFEYSIRGGMVDDTSSSVFSRAEVGYGLNRMVTVGGGYEYYNFNVNNSDIPFVNASFSPISNLLFSAEYAHEVRSVAKMSYRLPGNAVIDASYTRYDPDQDALSANNLEERILNIGAPLKFSNFNLYTRLGFRQNVYSDFSYKVADLLLSGATGRVSANLTTYANWTQGLTPSVSSNLAVGVRVGKELMLRGITQIDLNQMNLINYRVEVEKQFARSGYASVSYEENFRSFSKIVNLTFRYDLPFAQANTAARINKENVQFTEGFRGSLAYDSESKYVVVGNQTTIARGALTLVPFLDINFNDTRDTGEPLITGLELRINGGRFLIRSRDSLTRVMDLEPYTSYLLEMDNSGFENIAWQLRDKTLEIFIDPNQFKRIEIPVYPMGEINGTVYLQDNKSLKAQGRVLINIYTENGLLKKQVMSERDGYFTFLGLPPANYYATIDAGQLQKINMTTTPKQIEFTIESSEYGDIIDGLDFVLMKNR